jgi:hypothetical protein
MLDAYEILCVVFNVYHCVNSLWIVIEWYFNSACRAAKKTYGDGIYK